MSKGLEALERVKKFSVLLDSEKDIVKDLAEIIPNTLRIIEKELEALEIMIEKDITPSWFIRNLKQGMTYEDYHFSNSGGQSDMTREQFDILVEVLL